MAESKITLPNFFIVGAAKAGTTSVYKLLDGHPDIYMSPIKEPNFFSADVDINNFTNTFKKNLPDISNYFNQAQLKKLQQAFIRDEKDYKKLFENVQNETTIGEASTGYLYSKNAAENIFKHNPNSKILILLREPISRTFSHYLMAVRFGFTSLDFLNALKKDIKREDKGIGKSEMFIEMSLYYENIKRYLDVFPKKNVKIMFYEDFKTNPSDFMKELYGFLNLQTKAIDKVEIHNKATLPKNKSLNKLLTDFGVKSFVKKHLNKKLQNRLKSTLTSTGNTPQITEEERAFLTPFFEDDIQKTKALLSHLNFPW